MRIKILGKKNTTKKKNNPDAPVVDPPCVSACNPDSGVTWIGHLRLEA